MGIAALSLLGVPLAELQGAAAPAAYGAALPSGARGPGAGGQARQVHARPPPPLPLDAFAPRGGPGLSSPGEQQYQHRDAPAAAPPAARQPQGSPGAASRKPDGGTGALRIDAATAAELARLAAAKEAAVAAEDYDEAKRLKGAEERLRAVGARIAALEAQCARLLQLWRFSCFATQLACRGSQEADL